MDLRLSHIKEKKEKLLFAGIVAVLVLFNVYLWVQSGRISSSIEDLKFSLRRENTYRKRKVELEREVKKLEGKLSLLEKEIPTEQSDALVLVKVQTAVNKIAERAGVRVEYVQALSSRRDKSGVMVSIIGARVRGNPRRVIEFLDMFEQTAPSLGLRIAYAVIYTSRHGKNNELMAYLKIKALWRKANEEKA